MKPASLVIGLLSACLLVACGGSSATPQAVAASPVAVVVGMINGIVVPPDPGASRDATLAGVDTDGNGIRDEIDRWIASQYADKPGALEAIRMVAKIGQKLMLSNPVNQSDALAIVYESMDVGGCVGGKLRQEGIVAGHFFNELMFRTYDTRERIDARKKVFSLAGMIVRSTDEAASNCPYSR